jgi:hypothetical protein
MTVCAASAYQDKQVLRSLTLPQDDRSVVCVILSAAKDLLLKQQVLRSLTLPQDDKEVDAPSA